MIVNNIAQNPYSSSYVKALEPLRSEALGSSANTVPTNNRTVSETSVIKRPLNNVPQNFLRHLYINNQSSSNGSLTESFVRARASLSPAYLHNEVTTRYNMISAIPMKLVQIKKSIEKFA
jgi:hypothetical protein